MLTGELADEFMKSFNKILAENRLKTVSIKEHRDLRGPEYSHNIVSGENGVYYVDIQNFVFTDQNVLENNKEGVRFLRAQNDWVENFFNLLKANALGIEGKKVLLTGESFERLLPHILAADAGWCSLMLKNDSDLEKFKKAFYLYGFSRFEFFTLNEWFDNLDHMGMPAEYDIMCIDGGSVRQAEKLLTKLNSLSCVVISGLQKDDETVLQNLINKCTSNNSSQVEVLTIDTHQLSDS